MRSGSSAQDGSGWPSAHHPHQNEAVSGPGPYGSGPRSDPRDPRDSRDDQGGRHDAPFGPDISWPNGFRRLDTDSRRALEAGYGTGGYRTGQYDHVDPRHGAGGAGRGYQQPAVDEYGYGDPGYSDPSYDGPRNPYTGPMRQLGYTGPQRQVNYQPDIYPTTGAQEALPDTGPQPIAGYWTGQGSAYADQRRPGAADGPRHDGSRFDDPRFDDPRFDGSRFDGGRPRLDDPRAGGPRHGRTHATDPRLEGIRYDELRYDEPAYDDEPAYGGPRYDQPVDDVSWYEELRRSAPVYPDRPGGQPTGGQSAGGQRPADAPRPSDSLHPGDSRGPSRGQQPGYPQAPAREHPSGPSFSPGPSGPSGLAGPFAPSGPSGGPSGPSGPSGYGPGRDDRGGQGAQVRAAREIGTGPRPGAGPARPPAPPAPQALAFQDPGFREAPTVQVGVLTPPSGARMYTPQAEAAFVTAPPAGRALAPAVRPGHGLDGPEITGSWPAQPQADDLESFEDFWRADDEDEEYRGLFADEDYGDELSGSRPGPGRRTGRRRGRSRDHRLWLALLGVVIAASAAITAIIKFEFPSHGGPVHVMHIPASIGSFVRTPDMEKTTHLAELRSEVIRMSAGQASGVVSAVYESGNSASGGTEQIIMFIGGHLANAAPATSITDFTQNHAGAAIVSAGSLGGQASCVQEGAGTSNPVSMCVWFDNDSFGEIVSPTMNATALSQVMRTVRPDLEIVVKG